MAPTWPLLSTNKICMVLLWIMYTSWVWGSQYVEVRRADNSHRKDYQQMHRVDDRTMRLKHTIAIKQLNMEALTNVLMEVSTPGSASYGRHWSFEEVGHFTENKVGVSVVKDWLASQDDVTINQISRFGEYITFTASVATLEAMFQMEMYHFHPTGVVRSIGPISHQEGHDLDPAHTASSGIRKVKGYQKVIRALSYSLPQHVVEHVHDVLDLVSLPVPVRPRGKLFKPFDGGLSSSSTASPAPSPAANIHSDAYPTVETTLVNPGVLRSVYGVPSTDVGTHLATQAVFEAIGQLVNPVDIERFQNHFGIPLNPINRTVYSGYGSANYCSADDAGFNNCGEATLDVEYIASLAPSVPTIFW
jgi:tripeptidyl-peptidase I